MRRFAISFGGILLFPSVVLAHPLGGSGFLSGIGHPITGFDHLLAMVSVGILSTQIGGRAIWTVPLTFVVMMIFGGIMGMSGMPLPFTEFGIAFSVLALGVVLTVEKQLPTFLAMLMVGFFAIFHGHAHGTESYAANPLWYASGFAAGTAGLHIIGVLIGLITKQVLNGAALLRYVGAGIAAVGFHLVIAG
jgi:urease accessory protein